MERQSRKTATFQKELKKVLAHHVGAGKKYATKSDVARAAGVSKSNLTRYVTPGQARQPRAEILSKLSLILGYPEDYLYNLWAYCNGLTDTHPDHTRGMKKVADEPPHYDAGRIPANADDHNFYVRAKGKTMTGSASKKQTILEGDFLLVKPARQPKDGDIVFCRDKKKDGTVRSFQRDDNGDIRLIPLNDSYETIFLKKNKPCHCLVITEIKRELMRP